MISILIPTRNRSKFLSIALSSILDQEFHLDSFEVIVIDNGSSDNTQDVIRSFQERFFNLISIIEKEPGLHSGRHAGLKTAKGDILVFVDDDIEAFPNWLFSIYRAFIDPNVVLVGGNCIPKFETTPPKWLIDLWNFNSIANGYKSISALSIIEFTKVNKEISPYLIWGCNFAVRRELILQAGGFHPDGMPSELILFRGDGETHISNFAANKGLKAIFCEGASVFHTVTKERMTFNYFRNRGFLQGISKSYFVLRNGESPRKIFTVVNLFKILISKFFFIFLSKEAKNALSEYNKGHEEGYSSHQFEYKINKELKKWVHKVSYFDNNND